MLSGFLTALYQLTLFIFYFFYFLFKGKPEWQKGSEQRCKTNASCCLHSQNGTSSSTPQNEKTLYSRTERTCFRLAFSTSNDSYCSRCKEAFRKVLEAFKRFGIFIWRDMIYAATAVKKAFRWLYNTLFCWRSISPSTVEEQLVQRGFLEKNATAPLSSHLQDQQSEANVSKFMSETGAPFSTSPSTEGVALGKGQYSETNEATKDMGEFYSVKHSLRYETIERNTTGDSVPPPCPPLPCGVIRIPSSADNFENEQPTTTAEKVPKGGVAVLPPEIVAEASVRIKERERKTAEPQEEHRNDFDTPNTDWTVTSTRKIADFNEINEGQTRGTVGGRVSEQKFEQSWRPLTSNVVSRIPRPSNEDAQFIFRTSKPAQHIMQTSLPEGNFFMGRSVFSPVREVEEMRNSINRKASLTPSESRFSSRVNTPLDGNFYSSRVNTPLENGQTTSRLTTPYDIVTSQSQNSTSYEKSAYDSRSHSQLAERHLSPRSRSHSRLASYLTKQPVNQDNYTSRTDENAVSYLRHRSRTVEPRAENIVRTITRQWPPKSNATGVELIKDNWNLIPSEVTSCRRVMEKTVTDKWTMRDEHGALIDEWGGRSWRGESDGLRRRQDGTGETWHRTVDVDPFGKTSFVDNRRYYTRNYVVESETRNV